LFFIPFDGCMESREYRPKNPVDSIGGVVLPVFSSQIDPAFSDDGHSPPPSSDAVKLDAVWLIRMIRAGNTTRQF
jgi:hypothetical protein